MARYGGDEFVVALARHRRGRAPSTSPSASAPEIAAASADGGRDLTVSIGVATFPDDAGTKAELLDKADWAMYAAKRAGRDRVVAFRGAATPEA